MTLTIVALREASAGITVFNRSTNDGLTGFNAAAENPPISIDFDTLVPGIIDGAVIQGIEFQPSSTGSPLWVVNGNETMTVGFESLANPERYKLFPTSGNLVLSPGGVELAPGPNNEIENDDLTLIFHTPVTAFGFDHLSQSADGFSFTNIQVFNEADVRLVNATIPISSRAGGGGAADFWGAVTTGGDRIARIVINESDGNATLPDCNIGFDTFRFLAAAPALPADFDEDLDVDGDDLVEWSAGFGLASDAMKEDGDADVDGDVDGADFLIWQTQIGSGAATTLTALLVPEIPTIQLAVLAMALSGVRLPWLISGRRSKSLQKLVQHLIGRP